MGWLIEHGSYALLFAALVIAGFGVPIPEDVVLLAGGVLAHRGITSIPATAAVCFVGVLVGDAILFTMARRLGPAALERPAVARFLTRERRARIEALMGRHGGAVVFVGRHLAGARTPVFAMVAIHGMERWRFVLWDALALCVSAPLVLGLGYAFSDRIDLVHRQMARADHYLLLVCVAAFAGYVALNAWRPDLVSTGRSRRVPSKERSANDQPAPPSGMLR